MLGNISATQIFLFGGIPLVVILLWRHYTSKAWLSYAETKRNKALLEKCPSILNKVFYPTIYLQHGLLQTIFASSIPCKPSNLTYIMEEVNLQGGGHTSLAWAQTSNPKNKKQEKLLVIVIPGLTGSANDAYVKDLVVNITEQGYRCAVFQPRFNGGNLILPEEGYLDIVKDFKATIEHIEQKEKGIKLFGVGHSYGANLLTYYLGTHPQDDHFIGAVSLANPFNLLLSANKVKNSLVDMALTNFLQKTTEKSKKSLSEATRFQLDLLELSSMKNIRDFDRNLTIKVYGYETCDDYYWTMSSSRKYPSIKVPVLLLQAEDDPVVEHKAFVEKEIKLYSQNVILMMTKRGGHQGWVEGFFKWKRWYFKPTLEFLNAVVDTAEF